MRTRLRTAALLSTTILWTAACAGPRGARERTPRHPLEPLAAAELEAAVALLRAHPAASAELLIPELALAEPSKAELARYHAGEAPPRRARAVLYDPAEQMTIEAVLDLDARAVSRWTDLPGLQALTTSAETDAAEALTRADPRWQAAMRRRGIEDLDDCVLAAWASGPPLADGGERSRPLRVITYYRAPGETSFYGRPVEGVVATVDLARNAVVAFVDEGPALLPPESADFFDPRVRGPEREAPRPYRIRQPEGASFRLSGHEVAWQKWRFRYALHPREGLVLYDVRYEEEPGRARSILARASLSEMVVPYGDPDPRWTWRSAFDQGEYGLGWLANPLRLDADVPENATLLSEVFVDELGELDPRADVVALYERDGGLLWKHLDELSFERAETRRARELVIGYITTIGNYEYGFDWVFRQDGELEVLVHLTGILLPKGVPDERCAICREVDALPETLEQTTTFEPPGQQRYGTLVAPGVVATNHQHVFNFRLDLDVDGARNAVSEMNTRHEEGAGDADNAFLQEETVFARERDARRSIDLRRNRTWRVFNPSEHNSLGHHASYMLVPGANSVPFLGPDSQVRRKAAFMDHHLWATRYAPGELHASGDYPRMNPGTEGLSTWSGDESLYGEDVVLWYTLAVTHVPRAEEWPVMSAVEVGFRLIPWGFFARNPALDVPPSAL